MKKYEITNEKNYLGLRRIRCVRDFYSQSPYRMVPQKLVYAGQYGGWVENEYNLSHFDNCWIDVNAMVFKNARVTGNAYIHGRSKVYGYANVSGNCKIGGRAKVFGNAVVSGNAEIEGNAIIGGSCYVGGNALVTKNTKILTRGIISGNAYVSYEVDFENFIISEDAFIANCSISNYPPAKISVKQPLSIQEILESEEFLPFIIE